ncbi:MAG: hypothetical protein HUU15_12755 [Candidatus Brocadiae bacterium]|nr:hypothetical protein [Candidatus Brocadiia bacterium]
MTAKRPAFPVARWIALGWLLVWAPPYAMWWGWRNFFQLCDVAVILTAAGLWFGSARLLSAQAVGVIVVDILWFLDVAARLTIDRHPIGGTEYMFDSRFPLWVRLISLFHVAWPLLLLWALRRTGYDSRGWRLQSGIAGLMFGISWLIAGGRNVNFVLEAPIVGKALGPAPVHLAVSWAVLTLAVYWPTHAVLVRTLPAIPPPSPERA